MSEAIKEMSCNDFIKTMKDAGFSFKYRATNGATVITGEVKSDGNTTAMTHKTSEESRQAIKALFKKGN